MKIGDILRIRGRPVITAEPDETVQDAIQKMVNNRIGALPICDGKGNMVGIVSERDLLKECAQRASAIKQTKIKEMMTKEVIIGVPDDSIDYIISVMTQKGVRHLPIMAGSRLEGMISMRDIVQAQLEELKSKLEDTKAQVRYLSNYTLGETD
jgi:CBS domain-containing protein